MTATERSESLVELAKALSKFQGAAQSVPKKSVNPFYKSKYADLDAVWDMCRKPLSENGLSVVQTTTEIESVLYLETMLLHNSGEFIKSWLPLNAKAADPQSVGSAITYARRYAMSSILGVSADEDDDAERATDRNRPQRQPQRQLPKERTHPQDSVPQQEQSGTEQQGPVFTDSQLLNYIKGQGMEWKQFEIQVLRMPWTTWVKRAGTVATALSKWELWQIDHPNDATAGAAAPADSVPDVGAGPGPESPQIEP